MQALAEHAGWLTVRRFPGYAPELNPVEALWSSLKAGRMAGECPGAMDQLKALLKTTVTKMMAEQDLLRAFLISTPLYTQEDFNNVDERHQPE